MNEPRRWLDDTKTPSGLKQLLGVELESRELPSTVRRRVGANVLGFVGASAVGAGAVSKAAAAAVATPGGTGASAGVASGVATSGSGAVASGTAAGSVTVSSVAGGSSSAAVASGAKVATVAGVVTKGSLVAGGAGGATGGLLGVGATGSLVVNGIISAAIGTAAVVGVTQIDLGVDRASDPAAISAPMSASSSVTSVGQRASRLVVPGRSSAEDSLSVPSLEALRPTEEVGAEGEVEERVAQLAPNRAPVTSQAAPERRPSSLRALNTPGKKHRLRTKTPQLSKASEQVPDSLSREVKALREISSIVDTEPTRALQLVARHATDYPRSQLASERRLLEVRALLRVGRRTDAERVGQRLLETSTAGLYHSRVKQLLGRNVSSGAE